MARSMRATVLAVALLWLVFIQAVHSQPKRFTAAAQQLKSIGNRFTIEFSLTTTATNSVQLSIRDVGVLGSPKVYVTLADKFKVGNTEHTAVIDLLNIDTNPDTVSIDSTDLSLVHQNRYVFFLESTGFINGLLGVPEADLLTEPITLLKPASNTVLPESFELRFSKNELAAPGTIKANFTRTGGEIDPYHSRIVTFQTNFDNEGLSLILSFEPFDVAALFMDEVLSVTPPQKLVTNAIYSCQVFYGDAAGNAPVGSNIATGLLFDGETIPATINAPVVGSFKTKFSLNFTLPELAKIDSLRLEIHAFEPSIGGPTRRIYFNNEVGNSIGHKVIQFEDLSVAESTVTEITTVTPKTSLVHSAKYYFALAYRDRNKNDDALTITSELEFDNATALPVLELPVANSRVANKFSVRYRLLESGKSGTVRVILQNSQYRTVLVLSLRTAALHTFLVDFPFSSSDAVIDRQGDPLQHMEVYAVTIAYSDEADNVPANDTAVNVTYDQYTDLPSILYPQAGDYMNETLRTTFVLPEK